MASVEIQKLVKYYGDSQVLHGIDISIADGEFVVLVGPSGCGKSTLLRMVAGLEEISDGHVTIDGQIINDLPPKQRDLAMVFQSYALYPHMTVGENMGFSLRLAKRPKGEISSEVARVAEILGLTEYINRYPRHLSGGQRQRVAMGRAIVRDPKVFLFDEPLSNLDAKLRGQMRAEIKNMHRRLATTTIYVTHDQTEAMTMADKIVVLRDGQVEQIGSPMELFKNPRNQFVAGFIGSPSMNFLSGTVGERKIEFPDGTFIPWASEIPRSSGAPVNVGIRPRHFECGDANAAHNFIVDDVEPTGDEMEVRGRMHGETVTAVLETFEAEIGQTLNLSSQPNRRFVFDGDTGQRIF